MQHADDNKRILVIDDNPAIHEDIRKILSPESLSATQLQESAAAVFGNAAPAGDTAASPAFVVDCASQGEAGVTMVRRARDDRRPYAVAFVDARMPPGWDGIETIARLWREDPDVLVVLCTAYSDYTWREIRRKLPHPELLVILKKPFDNIEVLQLAEGLSEKWRLARSERRRLQLLERMIGERNRDLRGRVSIDHPPAAWTQPDANTGASANGAQRSKALEQALREAVYQEQLSLHYQPLVDIATHRVVSLEALLRWRHPQFGAIPPAEFIPIAEETGLIVPIGEFVLRGVCAQVVRWALAKVPVVPVAVNISAVQLEQGQIWRRARDILHEEGCQPSLLALELTESTIIKNAARHADAIQALRDDGVGIEIDDFGTGYSSLSTLKHLPIDTIKIDRSFITHLDSDRTDEAIVSAVLAMTHSLGLRAVAEGVETAAQLEVLARHGCEFAQGYYFCKPLIASKCEQLLIDLSSRKSFTDTLRLRQPGAQAAGPPGFEVIRAQAG
jgi:EAL domain-containing protein (putative c-di-GMP-specific phosphodiesterase class I)